MVLESTIVCLDNSEFSRNGDFAPSRFAAQVDSVNVLCSAKVQSNAESSVGLLTLAGRSARILITSTRDLGRVFTCMHDVKFDGMSDFVSGIQKAQLALKHRQNTNQRQRIVVFVSSPVSADIETLVKLGKKLKKNNVAVDVVNVGMEEGNVAKIDGFIEAVNSNENSRALHVEAGGSNLADAVMNSDIYMERGSTSASGGAAGGGEGGAGTGGNEFPFGVDPAVEPELAMVLQISMEEERARQAAARESEGPGEEAANPESGSGEPNTDGAGEATTAATPTYDDNDDDLYGTGGGDGEAMDVDGDDADAEMLRRAIEMSKAETDLDGAGPSDGKDEEKKDS